MTTTIENKKTLFVEVDVNNNSYCLDEHHYDVNFPLYYALSHIYGTGPKDCGNCREYGSWRGVFIGYCVNCANYAYNFTRGKGFIGNGIEVSVNQGVSVFDTYLKDVSLAEIGNYTEGKAEHVLDNNRKPIMFHAVYDNIIKYIDYRGYILGLGMDYNCLPEDFSNALKSGDFRNYFVKVRENEEYQDEEYEEDEDYSDLPDLIPCDDENSGSWVRVYPIPDYPNNKEYE